MQDIVVRKMIARDVDSLNIHRPRTIERDE